VAQAEGLLDTLADLRVERPLTSPSLRCRQTLLPLAAALDLDLSSVDDLGTDGDVDRLVDLLAAGDKGSTWVLDGAADGRSDARYLPPPAPRTKHRGGGRAWGDTHARLVETQRRVLGGLLPGAQPAPPARMMAGLTDAGVIMTTPASLPLSGLHSTTAAGRPLLPRPAGAGPVGQAGQLAEQLGGDLTIATDGAAPASLLLRFPLAALPDEVRPEQSPFPRHRHGRRSQLQLSVPNRGGGRPAHPGPQ